MKKSLLNKTNEKPPKDILLENIKNRKSEHNPNKPVSSFDKKTNIQLTEAKDENKKLGNNHKKLNNSRTKYQCENKEQKYVKK